MVAGAVVALAVGALVVAVLWLNAVSSEVTPVGRRYFSALLAGDEDVAYSMLCEEARART